MVSWNAGAERLYGYSAAEMIGRSISVLIPPYRPTELPEIFETIKQGEGVDGLETVRIRKDGTAVEVSLTISPIKDAGGRVVGASTVARDITRRKQEDNERLSSDPGPYRQRWLTSILDRKVARLSQPQHVRIAVTLEAYHRPEHDDRVERSGLRRRVAASLPGLSGALTVLMGSATQKRLWHPGRPSGFRL